METLWLSEHKGSEHKGCLLYGSPYVMHTLCLFISFVLASTPRAHAYSMRTIERRVSIMIISEELLCCDTSELLQDT